LIRSDLRPDDWKAIWPELVEEAPPSLKPDGNNVACFAAAPPGWWMTALCNWLPACLAM